MPSDFTLKGMNVVHRGLLKMSGNRFGAKVSGMQSLELTTIGRKSGQARSVMLTAPIVQGETLVVVASKGGNDEHPAWFLNLRDNPAVEVALPGGERRPMQARVASAEERAELWPKITGDFKQYGQYQTKTGREIPVVLLTPR